MGSPPQPIINNSVAAERSHYDKVRVPDLMPAYFNRTASALTVLKFLQSAPQSNLRALS